ncbi:serine/threonine-protein kinase [Mobiluncus porci]|uniref:non-specific serine/threonine protein kinase n=1 Tax=Mobiluncus porci TaxID=2652278 RepID=A0A7K0K0N0_9ACTO|nr:serine/threonine-protein kinase [Mobiluncus porci]MST49047.1 protein kinase [Mobiluncus porci]
MIGANTVLNDRYRLVSILARGGMGVIWRGWDKRSQNVVAIKVLKEDLIGQETFLARLRAEAVNASRLHHPNLAAVFDWGETEGQGWIVMELVEGRPLSDILSGGHTLPWDTLAPILLQIAGGLQASHEGHVIHRDVKPSNILVSDKGVAKLTDFGISLAPRAEALTAVGMVMGTAQYLPPEQAMGETATASGDIYALGVIAYEALAGKRPFTGPTQVDIAMAHVKDPVPPLPDSVPSEVAALIYKMLEKDPRNRPASAKEVQDTIRLLWKGEVPPSFTPRMSFARSAQPAEPTQEMPVVGEQSGAGTFTQGERSERSGKESDIKTARKGEAAPREPGGAAPSGQTLAAPFPSVITPQRSDPPAPQKSDPAGLAAAVPVGNNAISPSRHQAAVHRLEASSYGNRHSGERSKIIAAIVIMAVVVLALIIGLVTSTHRSSAVGNLDNGDTSSVMAFASSAGATNEEDSFDEH